MKFSKLFIPTTKEHPKDATLISHQYLLRAGFVSQEGAGLYNYMPLGKIVLDKITTIVKDELDLAGCNEVSLSFVTPMTLWEQSGRAQKMGQEMLRVKDRKNGEFVLSPTNEEAMVNLIKGRVTSYKNLPLNLYQINTKFRDEARPRFGLLRSREFIMKDGYSFHSSKQSLESEFALMQSVYKKIFTRLGLEFRVVDANSGAIGGSGSKEFMVLAQSGEDTIVVCDRCDYSANIEASTKAKRESKIEAPEANFGKFSTPDIKTIDDLSKLFSVDKHYILKAVIKKAIYDDKDEIVVFFIRGNEILSDMKSASAIGANEIVDASLDEIEKAGLKAGFVGPINLDAKYVIDKEVRSDKALICGANEIDYHYVGVDLSSIICESADIIEVQEGDSCTCGGKFSFTKGIEVGHIFQLGTTYTQALQASFLDENGKSQIFQMGTYGIGISRLIAAIIEQHHDDRGCKWPLTTSPYSVDIIISNIKDEEQFKAGHELYERLKASKIEVILDDRKDRFGAKIKDYELIGFRYGVIIGKNLNDGIVEIIDRNTLNKEQVKLDEVYDKLQAYLS